MKLSVRNFGSISEAFFELSRVTVLLGSNASGKSLLSYMIYSLSSLRIPDDLSMPEDMLRRIDVSDGEESLSNYLDIISKVFTLAIGKRLEQVFGVPTKKLVKRGEKDGSVELETDRASLSLKLEDNPKVELKLKEDVKLEKRIHLSEDDDWKFNIDAKSEQGRIVVDVNAGTTLKVFGASRTLKKEFLLVLSREVYKYLFGNAGLTPAVIVPTERILTAMGYENALKAMKESEKPVLREFASELVSAFKAMRGSTVRLVKLGNKSISYRVPELYTLELYEDGEKVAPSLMSSGVSQVVTIDLLSHIWKFMIIEEPELNLHADAQVDVANYLAELAHEKTLFITTHSDIFTIQMAINSVKHKFPLKIYLLNNGEIEEVEYTERGDVEEIPTIGDVIRNQIKEIYG